jgi:cell division protein FtsW
MLRPGHVVFLCALALLAIGVVMVNSAGMNIDPVSTAAPEPPAARDAGIPGVFQALLTGRPAIYMALALVAMSLTAVVPVGRLAGAVRAGPGPGAAARSWLRPWTWDLPMRLLVLGAIAFVCIVATAYIPGLSRAVNGSRRWVSLPLPGLRAVSIQPSEIVKWGLVAVVALYGAGAAARIRSFWGGLVPGLAAVAVVAGAVAHEDLGTGVLIFAVGCVLLLAAGARLWQFLLFIPPAAAGLVVLIISNPYRLTRIESFVNPYLQPQGSGYHMIQSMLAVAGGEGFGRGLGYGLQKFGYLPEDTTDFLFAIICEELGIAGAAVVIALYVALLWAGLAIVRRQRWAVLKLLGLGIITTVGLQALINLAVVTGLGPTKGIALPLVSSGGTGWILTAASLGLLVAMDGLVGDEPAESGAEGAAAGAGLEDGAAWAGA